jgi:uncharacterized protein
MNRLIKDLSSPNSLPDQTENVSVVQTHISVVFIADNYVYKIKKPVNFGFLDFSTLEKRKYYCEQEIELNRRLSKNIYLSVLPVIFDGKFYSFTGHAGETVEYAVKMKRIPDDSLMKSLFLDEKLTDAHLEKIAEVLARFHDTAKGDPKIDRFGRAESFKINTDENFMQIEPFVGRSIDKETFYALKEWTELFYSDKPDLFEDRIARGKIRDCHGDLHMEHVCFGEDVAVIDCIEFNERFRYSDTIADFAFLLMDLEYHGGTEQADRLSRFYMEQAGEGDVEDLLTFYKVYRAVVRGKVNGFQLNDAHIAENKRMEAIARAREYFRLAESYLS